MKITPLHDAAPRPRRVAVGEFDGVHRGHREVIAGADTVLTFDPHPLAVLRPEAAPPLLTSTEQKADLVAALGVEELVVIGFDARFAAQTAQEFIDRVLVARLAATHVAVGENFRFGHRAQGDTALLSAQRAFETRVAPLVACDGEPISSSRIRALVADGDVARAGALLGAPYELRGPVVHGDERGRTLGFPTANLVPPAGHVCPAHGVYAARASVAGGPQAVAAAVNVGVRPTFDSDRGVLVEAHLLDLEADLYDRELRLTFVERLRGERRFDGAEALVAQMHADVDAARAIVARP